MTTKPRSPGKTAISVSMTQALLDQVDERASSLNLTRSQYIAQLARADVAAGGDLTLREEGKNPKGNSADVPADAGSRATTEFSSFVKGQRHGKTGA